MASLFDQHDDREQQRLHEEDLDALIERCASAAGAGMEIERLDQVMRRFEATHGDWLTVLRGAMRLVYRRRCRRNVEAYVTADDARRVFESLTTATERTEMLARNPKAMNFMGALFQAPGWVWTGDWSRSETPGSHRNMLRRWRWDEAKAQQKKRGAA